MIPEASPRLTGEPRPDSSPSSEAASVKPIEMPAPTEAATPTRKVVQVSWVAKAVAKIGASVETDPSISPARPGCTQVRMNWRWAAASSPSMDSTSRCVSASSPATAWCPASAAARSPKSLRVAASVVRAAAAR